MIVKDEEKEAGLVEDTEEQGHEGAYPLEISNSARIVVFTKHSKGLVRKCRINVMAE